MDNFWSLFRESIIVQSFITAALVVGVLIMYVRGQEVPQQLTSALMLVLGFWFGTKTQHILEGSKKQPK